MLKHWIPTFLYKEILLPSDTLSQHCGLTSLAQLWKPELLSRSVALVLKVDIDLIKGFDGNTDVFCNVSSGCTLILSMYAVEMFLSSCDYIGNKLN